MILLLILLLLCCCCCCCYWFWWRALSKDEKDRYSSYKDRYTFRVIKTTEIEVKDLTSTVGQKYLNTSDVSGVVDEEENLDYVDPAVSARRSFFGFKQTKSKNGGSDEAPQRDSAADYDADLELPKSHPSRLIRARKANKNKLKMSDESIAEEGTVQDEISREMLPPSKAHPKGVIPPQHRFTSVHQNAGKL